MICNKEVNAKMYMIENRMVVGEYYPPEPVVVDEWTCPECGERWVCVVEDAYSDERLWYSEDRRYSSTYAPWEDDEDMCPICADWDWEEDDDGEI